MAGSCGSCDDRAFKVIRRDIALLALLTVAVVPAYLFTRSVAERNRKTETRIAAEWFQRGQQQLREGDAEAAMESLRNASVHDRGNPKIGLALARVLVAGNRDGEARTALLRLRESSPNDPEIDLELARLEARSGEVEGALLHYHQALYGPSPGPGAEERSRAIRLELVRFLLEHGEKGRAVSEVIVLAADTPSEAASHLEVAELFLEAGDATRAREQFLQASRLGERSGKALAGAGEASFLLGEYSSARRYLERAVAEEPGAARAAQLLETARLIRSADPLAARIPFAERMRRLLEGFEQASSRLDGCLESQGAAGPPLFDLIQLHAEVALTRPALEALGGRRDPDLLQSGVELVFRIEEATSRNCGEPTGLDLALLLIGRLHGGTGA